MANKNPFAAFFDGLFKGKFWDHVKDEALDSITDNQEEIERYNREVQRFNAIHRRHKEIQEEQDKLLGDDEL